MLIKFLVDNWMSFKDPSLLSMIATKDTSDGQPNNLSAMASISCQFRTYGLCRAWVACFEGSDSILWIEQQGGTGAPSNSVAADGFALPKVNNLCMICEMRTYRIHWWIHFEPIEPLTVGRHRHNGSSRSLLINYT